MKTDLPLFLLVLLATSASPAVAATAGKSGDDDVLVARGGRTTAVVVVAPNAGKFEKRAADDLVKYVGLMSGARPRLASERAEIDAALKGKEPVLIVGSEALRIDPTLARAVKGVLKKDPHLRTDGGLGA